MNAITSTDRPVHALKASVDCFFACTEHTGKSTVVYIYFRE